MSDESNSGGIIGSIVTIFILVAIWPYLLAIFGLYIAYLVALSTLEWLAQHPLIAALIILGVFSLYIIYRYRLIPKAFSWMIALLKLKTSEVHFTQCTISEDMPGIAQRKFIPSSNLYCYGCTRKLGIQALENKGKYFCSACYEKRNRT